MKINVDISLTIQQDGPEMKWALNFKDLQPVVGAGLPKAIEKELVRLLGIEPIQASSLVAQAIEEWRERSIEPPF